MLFKKLSNNASGLFKKLESGTQKAFKKDGIVGKVGAGLQKGAQVVGKIADVGSNILSKVQASPLGAFVPTPVFGMAQNVLKGVSNVGKIAGAAGDISKQLTSGKGVKQITNDVIERAVKAKEDVGPSFI